MIKKLSNTEVKVIRTLAQGEVTRQVDIAKNFGVTQAMVSYIKNKKRRSSV